MTKAVKSPDGILPSILANRKAEQEKAIVVTSPKNAVSYIINDEEKAYLKEILRLTGREERLDREPSLTKTQQQGFKAILPHLRGSTHSGRGYKAKCDLLNRALLILGIKPMSHNLFEVVFRDVDFSKLKDVEECVRKFRAICMLEYGNIRFGYKVLKNGKDTKTNRTLEVIWSKYFPETRVVECRVREYMSKPPPLGLENIPANQLFALGYLSIEQSKDLNKARSELRQLLDSARVRNVKNYKELEDISREFGIDNLGDLVGKAGIPDADELLYLGLFKPPKPYGEIISSSIANCEEINEEDIIQAKEKGMNNTTAYLGMHDVDIYTATSMRDPLHFTTNHAFVNSLFNQGELQDWHLRFFDPTQSYLPDRIQKGLVESLMIKRSRVTIYNAQEADTFGKDSEAAVALGQGKEVIVYVARLFSERERLSKFYKIVDSWPRTSAKNLLRELIKEGFFTEHEATILSAPEKSMVDVVGNVCCYIAKTELRKIDRAAIEATLLHFGYQFPNNLRDTEQLVEFAAERVSKLERRAIMFKEIHPLSFQVSAADGVARGVIVTRSIEDTAYILRRLLIGGLEYEETEDTLNITLYEKKTHSPMRIVTKEPTLTTAFWAEFARD